MEKITLTQPAWNAFIGMGKDVVIVPGEVNIKLGETIFEYTSTGITTTRNIKSITKCPITYISIYIKMKLDVLDTDQLVSLLSNLYDVDRSSVVTIFEC